MRGQYNQVYWGKCNLSSSTVVKDTSDSQEYVEDVQKTSVTKSPPVSVLLLQHKLSEDYLSAVRDIIFSTGAYLDHDIWLFFNDKVASLIAECTYFSPEKNTVPDTTILKRISL